MAMIRTMVEEGLIDRAFVQNSTRGLNPLVAAAPIPTLSLPRASGKAGTGGGSKEPDRRKVKGKELIRIGNSSIPPGAAACLTLAAAAPAAGSRASVSTAAASQARTRRRPGRDARRPVSTSIVFPSSAGRETRPGPVYVAAMGFKSSLLVYTSGEPADLLRQPPPPDPAQSGALVAATHPGWTGTGEPANGSLHD